MNLQQRYPKLFEKLEEKELQLRHLLNVDANEEDYDSEEFEFDFEEYNFIVYIAEPVQQALGKEKMGRLVEALQANGQFENFLASEEDLYGLKSKLDEAQIASLVLDQIEEIV